MHHWFHDHLNPRLWQGEELRMQVRLKLLKTAIVFYRFLDVRRLVVKDFIFTGSNAAYNYTSLSDLDVHLIVDFGKTACPDLAENFFTTKKTLWNQTYHATIYGQPVELYVEDITQPVTANGIFSLLHNTWIKQPRPIAPKADDSAVMQKTDAYAEEIEALLIGQPTVHDINGVLARLRILRRNGLLAGGEFSVENLAFKTLRARGCLQKLYDAKVDIQDRDLSLS